jgi:hypothetical protein
MNVHPRGTYCDLALFIILFDSDTDPDLLPVRHPNTDHIRFTPVRDPDALRHICHGENRIISTSTHTTNTPVTQSAMYAWLFYCHVTGTLCSAPCDCGISTG